MLTKEELKIVDLFRKDIFRSCSMREIMRLISKKSYKWTFDAVNKLKKLNIVTVKKKGTLNICSISLDSNLAVTYLAFIEGLEASKQKLPRKNIDELINSIPLSYFTFIIAGSYAKGKSTKKSDLDIVVLVENGIDTKKILTILKNKGELMVPEAHPHVFTKSEFLQMLLSAKMNYGKMVFKDRLIVFGAESYYSIVKEAIKQGFKGI